MSASDDDYKLRADDDVLAKLSDSPSSDCGEKIAPINIGKHIEHAEYLYVLNAVPIMSLLTVMIAFAVCVYIAVADAVRG